jgi:hypothetical protein
LRQRQSPLKQMPMDNHHGPNWLPWKRTAMETKLSRRNREWNWLGRWILQTDTKCDRWIATEIDAAEQIAAKSHWTEARWPRGTASEDFRLEDISRGWQLAVGRWIERLGWNDKNGTLADGLELNSRTILKSGQMPKGVNRVWPNNTPWNADIMVGDQAWGEFVETRS